MGTVAKFCFMKVAVVWAAIHFVLTILCMVISMASTSVQFDNPDYTPSPIAEQIGFFAEILMQPMFSLWTPWMSRNMPDIVEWLILFGNSVLWGMGIAAGIQIWTTIRHRRKLSGT